ncbi:MAG: glycosyl hydrolase family 18 protein [Phycisphaeraceae bacterium]
MATPLKPRKKPGRLRRILILLLATFFLLILAYSLWSPGLDLRDGTHDLHTNGIWLQHGWLGHDDWFTENNRDPAKFRDVVRIDELALRLKAHHIRDVFPHLCPCSPQGRIAKWDEAQAALFLDRMEGFRVLPWVGGVLNRQARPNDPAWRKTFCDSVRDLLEKHPRLAGVHINIEPLPSGDAGFLTLLEELKRAMPAGKVLSVAAYPPPTRWHPYPEVHWEEAYFRAVSQRVDQVVVMMYDTAIRHGKVYQSLMSAWTQEVLAWSADTPVLLGVPVYDDADSGYHHPEVENLEQALMGIHAGLRSLCEDASDHALPANYQGIAIYSEWEMNENEWHLLRERFIDTKP